MGHLYDRVEAFQEGVTSWSKPKLAEELALFAELADLFLSAIDSMPRTSPDDDSKSPLIMLTARMFNDFECAKRMLLLGLLEQVYMPMRDAVECCGLLHAFLLEPRRAVGWIRDMKEYHPGDVQALLKERDRELIVYKFYPMFSLLTHPNILGSVTVVKDIESGQRLPFTRVYHYGGYKNEPWIRMEMRGSIVLFLVALVETCALVYASLGVDVRPWKQVIDSASDRLNELGFEIDGIKEPSAETYADRRAGELVKRHIKFDLDLFRMGDINGAEDV